MALSFWHVRDCSLFQRLSDSQLDALEQRSRIRKFPKGSSVYLPTDSSQGAFLLAEGRVRICASTPDGKQSILAFVEPGELFGELALVEGGQREERAEVVLNSSVILIPGDYLRELMEQSPQLTLGVTKLIGMRRKRVERRLRSLLFRNNRDRLTHLLVELAEQYGNATSEGIELTIRLSHQDLASIIGATRETVTTLLGEMQTEGLLRIRRQRLVLLNLQKLAGADAAAGLTSTAKVTGGPPPRQASDSLSSRNVSRLGSSSQPPLASQPTPPGSSAGGSSAAGNSAAENSDAGNSAAGPNNAGSANAESTAGLGGELEGQRRVSDAAAFPPMAPRIG